MSDGQALCSSPLQSLHLFGSLGDPAALAELPQFSQTLPTPWAARDAQPRLWLVQGTGRSRQRRDGAATLTPLTRQQVAQNVGSFAERPVCKLSVKCGGQWSRRPIVIDGDSSLLVYASDVTVSAVVPPGVQSTADASTALSVPARAVALDDILGCEILAVPTSDGYAATTASQYVVTTAGAATRVPIPHGAVSVLVQPQTAATPLGTVSFCIGDADELGGVAWTLGTFTPNNTPVRVPGATHIEFSSDPAARGFTLTYQVR